MTDLFLIGLIVYFLSCLWTPKQKGTFIPTPNQGIPGLGHLLHIVFNDLQKLDFFTWMHKMSTHFPIFTFHVLNKQVYWLSDYEHAKEILVDHVNQYRTSFRVQRSSEFADPHAFIFGKNIGNGVEMRWCLCFCQNPCLPTCFPIFKK
jgi:hypothetical protein